MAAPALNNTSSSNRVCDCPEHILDDRALCCISFDLKEFNRKAPLCKNWVRACHSFIDNDDKMSTALYSGSLAYIFREGFKWLSLEQQIELIRHLASTELDQMLCDPCSYSYCQKFINYWLREETCLAVENYNKADDAPCSIVITIDNPNWAYDEKEAYDKFNSLVAQYFVKLYDEAANRDTLTSILPFIKVIKRERKEPYNCLDYNQLEITIPVKPRLQLTTPF